MKNNNEIAIRESELRLAIHQTHDCEAEALEGVVDVKIRGETAPLGKAKFTSSN